MGFINATLKSLNHTTQELNGDDATELESTHVLFAVDEFAFCTAHFKKTNTVWNGK